MNSISFTMRKSPSNQDVSLLDVVMTVDVEQHTHIETRTTHAPNFLDGKSLFQVQAALWAAVADEASKLSATYQHMAKNERIQEN